MTGSLLQGNTLSLDGKSNNQELIENVVQWLQLAFGSAWPETWNLRKTNRSIGDSHDEYDIPKYIEKQSGSKFCISACYPKTLLFLREDYQNYYVPSVVDCNKNHYVQYTNIWSINNKKIINPVCSKP